MTDEELKIVIDQLHASNSKDEAAFGVYLYGGQDEGYIKANKGGLQMFAAELLRASIDGEAIIKNQENRSIPLAYGEEWIDQDSDTFLQYVEPMGGTREKPMPISNNDKPLKDQAFNVGCIALSVFLFACICLGLGKMWTMIFG